MTKGEPPKLFLRFFQWFCHPELRKYIEGDLMELYDERLKIVSKRKADWKFILDVLLLFRPGIIRPAKGFNTANNYDMFKSYFKITWRNLVKNKGYSSINIIGLATGMTVALLIGVWVWDELSFDSHFQNHERLAQVMLNQTDKGITYTGGTIAPPIADPIKTRFGGDFKGTSLVSWNNNHVTTVGEIRLSKPGMWVQRDFPEMFTLDMVYGNRDALKDPSTMMLSYSLAKSLFGDADPMNKTVRIDNRLDMTVGGVYKDLPRNTTFAETKLLLSWDHKDNWLNTVTDWDNHSCQMYVQLADHATIDQVTAKIKNIPTPHITEWGEEIMVHPMDKIHLYDEFEQGKASGGRIEMVWLIGIIGAFVLLLACINFMNLSTARSEKRAKEVGIRKTIGSVRGQIISQFLTESIVIAFAAFLVSLVLAQVSLPFFNTMAGKQTFIPWSSPVFWLCSLGFTFFTGVISGSYPAFYLSAFKPVKVLKGTLSAGRHALTPRRVLVVIQFTVSITLIISTMIVFRQIQFAKDRLPGFSREGLITAYMSTPELYNHFEALKSELLQTGYVDVVTRASQSPAHFGNNNGIEWRGKDPGLVVFFRNVDVSPDFGKAIGWKIKEGRDFSYEFADSSSVILNETALKITGLKNPIGEIIKYGGREYKITGIVEDMLTQSPYRPMEPAVFFTDGWQDVAILKLNPTKPVRETLAKIEPIFKKHNPTAPFEYSFVDEDYSQKFANEERIGSLAAFFAVLAIFISCLGLFGLASFVAEQRTKEIGIRKVLGASVTNLWQMLSKDFVVLVIISCVISIPISFLSMNEWLQNYEYRTTITVDVFVVAALGALIVTLFTVSFQAIKAAVGNPVNSLRSE